MPKLIFTVGLPRSGKTTWSKKWQKEASLNRSLICRDDIRLELSGISNKADLPRDGKFEKLVSEEQERRIFTNFYCGIFDEICVSDTNLNPKTVTRLKNAALRGNPHIEIEFVDHFLDVSLPDIFARNAKSGSEYVPEEALFKMWETYVKGRSFIQQDKSLVPCITCDLDGTLAIHNGRSPYEFHRCGEDLINETVAHMLWAYTVAGFSIILVSGRDDSCRSQTEQWLADNAIDYDSLFMRKTGDRRPDWQVKEEILRQEILSNYYVMNWIDDRYQVVLRMRELGIPVSQVDFGRF